MIGFEHVKELIKKIVGILMDKLQKVMNVGFMKSSITTTNDCLLGHIPCLPPKLQDPVKSSSRKSTAEKDVIKRDKLTLE